MKHCCIFPPLSCVASFVGSSTPYRTTHVFILKEIIVTVCQHVRIGGI